MSNRLYVPDVTKGLRGESANFIIADEFCEFPTDIPQWAVPRHVTNDQAIPKTPVHLQPTRTK